MIWNIDGVNSAIGFSVKHLMFSTVKGRFHKVIGKIDWDENNLANSSIEATVEIDSLNTGEKSRDKNLRSPDFFDVNNYPIMTFKSTQIKKVGPGKYHLIGGLTIRNVTRTITFEVNYTGQASNPFAGDSAAFKAHAAINRKDFGLGWNPAIEAGGMMVGDHVKIELHVRAVKATSGELVEAEVEGVAA